MRALETIANSIRVGYIHPTVIVNTLIEVDNEGGLNAVRHIERHLNNGLSALQQRHHPHSDLAGKWLNAARAYLVTQADRKQAV